MQGIAENMPGVSPEAGQPPQGIAQEKPGPCPEGGGAPRLAHRVEEELEVPGDPGGGAPE